MNTFQVSSEKTTLHNTYGGRRYICVFLSLPTVCSAVEDKQTWSSKNTEQKIVGRKKKNEGATAAAPPVQPPQQQEEEADEAQEEEEASRPWQLCNTKWRGQTRSLQSEAALAGRRRRRRRVTTTERDKRAKTKQKKQAKNKKTKSQTKQRCWAGRRSTV